MLAGSCATTDVEQTSNTVRIFTEIKQRPHTTNGFDRFSFHFYTSFMAKQQIFSREEKRLVTNV